MRVNRPLLRLPASIWPHVSRCGASDRQSAARRRPWRGNPVVYARHCLVHKRSDSVREEKETNETNAYLQVARCGTALCRGGRKDRGSQSAAPATKSALRGSQSFNTLCLPRNLHVEVLELTMIFEGQVEADRHVVEAELAQHRWGAGSTHPF